MKIGSTRNTLVNTGHPTTNKIFSKYILKSYVGLLFHLSENWTLEQATGSGESKCSARGIHQCLFLSFLKCFPTISQLLSPSSIQLCKHTSDNNDSEILAIQQTRPQHSLTTLPVQILERYKICLFDITYQTF